MTTIEGKIEDANGVPQHVLITFISKSTPLAAAGVITGNSSNSVRTLAADGTFEIDLKAGNYTVTYSSEGFTTTFSIAISPDDDGETLSIEDVVSSPLEFVETAPNTVWNGTRAGHITFDPIDNAPAIEIAGGGNELVDYDGASIINGDSYSYYVTYETADGETAGVNIFTYNSANESDKALRLPLEVSPTRVVTKRIWRNTSDAGSTFRLLAEVGPAVAYYDDWETHTQFALRATGETMPSFNTTAGIIYAESGTETLYFSISGLRVKVASTFDGVATFLNEVHVRAINPTVNFYSTDYEGGLTAIGALIDTGAGMFFSAPADKMFGVQIGGSIKMMVTSAGFRIVNAGESAGRVLTCDADGVGTWQVASGSGAIAPGVVNPNSNVVGNPGQTYRNTANDTFWHKDTGTGTNTGWSQLI